MKDRNRFAVERYEQKKVTCMGLMYPLLDRLTSMVKTDTMKMMWQTGKRGVNYTNERWKVLWVDGKKSGKTRKPVTKKIDAFWSEGLNVSDVMKKIIEKNDVLSCYIIITMTQKFSFTAR